MKKVPTIMHDLAKLIAERIASGLGRKTITNCAKWAERYRKMGAPFPGPWGWDFHPWLYEMHLADSSRVIGQKSAQMGYSEWLLNMTFYAMDIEGVSVLYILPSDGDASDFSAARFDKALEASDYLARFFADVKNVGHKRAGNTSLYVRGSKSRSKLKSIDTALLIFDEMDEMSKDNFNLALERQSGQRVDTKQVLCVSTPTREGVGINAQYQLSTQEHFWFKCPSCSRYIEFKFPESIVITAENELDPRIKDTHYICYECKAKLPCEIDPNKGYSEAKRDFLKHEAFGGTSRFVAGHSDREWKGFYVNQMYSATIAPYEFAATYLAGKRDPTAQTEFFNSKMGLPHAVEGSKISDDDLLKCSNKTNFVKGSLKGDKRSVRTMGVDIGGVCHVNIEEWEIPPRTKVGPMLNDFSIPYVLYEGKTSGSMNDFTELDRLMTEWAIDGCVVDAEPERREAYRFASRHRGKVLTCDFIPSQTGRQVITNEEELSIKVNRTSWMDLALSRFKTDMIRLPRDYSVEYAKHLKQPQRMYKKDRWGNPFAYYDSDEKADHFAFSRVFSEIALGLAMSRSSNQDIKGCY
jgi:hypothetical protein